MARILVTGASGQLGREIEVISKKYFGYEFNFTDINELDITDPEKVNSSVKDFRPDWIINCAAYNFVEKAESEPEKAMLINGTAVRNITSAIRESECKFIHISSDYVFNGSSTKPYSESDLTDPLSAYGKSKLAGEKYALEFYGTMILRTSWLYSAFGENFLKTILKKTAGNNEVKVVFDQTGTPTYAADLAGAILDIVAGVIRNQLAFNTGIYHYSNEGVCSWYDFAVEIVREAGIDCMIRPVLSREFPSSVTRPSYSVLNKGKIKENYGLEIPHWRDSLKKCIEIIQK
ncbi:MAG: dTDP-4-dehydrorhamnose reductase [Bacteroidales bacterium]|nr:dTDP-4-dehydrorhamnose reductase [Bacteroidales bacterium]